MRCSARSRFHSKENFRYLARKVDLEQFVILAIRLHDYPLAGQLADTLGAQIQDLGDLRRAVAHTLILWRKFLSLGNNRGGALPVEFALGSTFSAARSFS